MLLSMIKEYLYKDIQIIILVCKYVNVKNNERKLKIHNIIGFFNQIKS